MLHKEELNGICRMKLTVIVPLLSQDSLGADGKYENTRSASGIKQRWVMVCTPANIFSPINHLRSTWSPSWEKETLNNTASSLFTKSSDEYWFSLTLNQISHDKDSTKCGVVFIRCSFQEHFVSPVRLSCFFNWLYINIKNKNKKTPKASHCHYLTWDLKMVQNILFQKSRQEIGFKTVL